MAQTRIHFSVASVDEPGGDTVRRIGPAGGDWSVFVLNGHGRRFWTRSSGAFSIKWMAQGRARYALDRRPRLVSRDAAVLVDRDQPYEMEFDARGGGESFCLFYSPALVAEAWASVEAGLSPTAAEGVSRGFPNVAFQPSASLAGLLNGLHDDGPDACETLIESRLLLVLNEAIETAHRHRRIAPRLPAAKPATRAHVLGLVERARAMIDAADGVGVGLASLAAEAGLSKFHLLRLFKAAHGVTPLAYAESRRMATAAHLLITTRRSVGEVAAELGYDSPSAFAKAFRRHRSASPAAFRASRTN
jgi:AraC family transcriptional regulator